MFALAKPIAFTAFQIAWSYLWATVHLKIRRDQSYALGRVLTHTNLRYKIISFFLFASQAGLSIATFWSNSELLLKVHDSDHLRYLGVAITIAATALYLKSIKYLGKNYSPCYDSYAPYELVRSGPYKWIRHPMYLAKLLLMIATFILSGSFWFVPQFIYLAIDMAKTIRKEETYLSTSFPGYINYQRTTKMVLPYIL